VQTLKLGRQVEAPEFVHMVMTVDHELDRITYGGEPKQPPSVAEKYPKAPSGHNASPFDAAAEAAAAQLLSWP
jgi:hypothetical protein